MNYNTDILEKLSEIHLLLIEAYNHYFAHETYCKSSEAVVSLHFPNIWDLRSGNTDPEVEIYSYVLTNGRTHHFDSLDKALEAVRQWHEKEMNTDRLSFANDFAENEEYNIKFAKF